MKNKITLITLIFITATSLTFAQSGYGIKAGLSYNSNGELAEIINNTQTVINNKGNGKSGYNIGFYGKLDLGPLYIRPELVYTKTTSEYELNSTRTDYKLSKLDAPILIGIHVLGPLKVFAGPAFQYILTEDFNGLQRKAVEKDFTVGLNIGAALELGALGIDVRYERGLKSNETSFIDNNIGSTSSYTLDSRPSQIIFSVSYRLSQKK